MRARGRAPGAVPYATFFASAAIAAWFGGRRPGLVATAFGGALAWYVFVPGLPGMTGYEVAGRLRGTPSSDGVVLSSIGRG
jgi:hypothetical protein